MNNTNKQSWPYYQELRAIAPLLQGGHPIAYRTSSVSSILDPYNNSTINFPTRQMPDSIYKHFGNGYYATTTSQESNFRQTDFQIGIVVNPYR